VHGRLGPRRDRARSSTRPPRARPRPTSSANRRTSCPTGSDQGTGRWASRRAFS
jgi:hypothetical protein